MAPLIAKRTTNLLVLLLTVVTASADGDEINIRIIKKRHPYLDLIGVDQTPDQVPMLDWDATYRIILHDVDLPVDTECLFLYGSYLPPGQHAHYPFTICTAAVA
ncbi:MAG: hypothetical protein JST83_02980 [Bacteroidetes bacterium]|nr:hypothetical protein [Bacteroidota bacterium]